MTLAPGTRLGPHEVAGALGAGGMGEVFRARDTKLDRDVAIKVLASELAENRERLARFEREAKLLASLNHPNIAHVYGFESALLPDGTTAHFLAMELVEGEDLSARLTRGALPLDEALPLAIQVAEGLEQAHEYGIIHRDLKPANIRITPDGRVKILDFGLAKALEGDPSTSAANSQLSHSPTMSRHMTEAGMIMGTAPYMSPEQARGKTVDKRADIWAFGVVLFEMLTGERLFTGETVSDVLAAVLTRDLGLGALPSNTPSAIRQLLRRCLERNPKNRLHDIADARIVLDEAIQGGSTDGPPAGGPAAAGPRSRSGTALPWVAGLALGALIAGLAGWGLGLRKSPPSSKHFRAVTSFAGVQAQPALSPDGRSVAFVSNRDGDYDIYVGLIGGGTMIRITNDTNLESRPAWSPDGTSIVYSRLNEWGLWDIWQVPALGGASRRLILNAADAAWSPDGRSITYASGATGTIWISDPAGQKAREVTRLGGQSMPARVTGVARDPVFSGTHDMEPRFSPDGLELAYVTRRGGPRSELNVVNLRTGEVRHLTAGDTLALSPAWSPDGLHLYFASSQSGTMNLWKISKDGGLTEQVTAGQGDDLEPDVSADGSRIVFATHRENLGFARLDLTAKPGPDNPRQLAIDLARNQIGPAYSPDGTRLAYFSNLKGVEKESIWVSGADGKDPVALVQDGLVNIFPKWSPDGSHMIYLCGNEYRSAPVAGGTPVTLRAAGYDYNFDVGADGRLLFRNREGRIQSIDPSSPVEAALGVSGLSDRGWLLRWSPDGRYIAYNILPGRESDPDAGLWVEDLQAKPRQVFRGWVTWYARGPGNQIFIQEGKPDLNGALWKVGWDGKGLTRLSSMRLAYSYWAASKGLLQNYMDISPDGRYVVFGSLNILQANIGMIENGEADRP